MVRAASLRTVSFCSLPPNWARAALTASASVMPPSSPAWMAARASCSVTACVGGALSVASGLSDSECVALSSVVLSNTCVRPTWLAACSSASTFGCAVACAGPLCAACRRMAARARASRLMPGCVCWIFSTAAFSAAVSSGALPWSAFRSAVSASDTSRALGAGGGWMGLGGVGMPPPPSMALSITVLLGRLRALAHDCRACQVRLSGKFVEKRASRPAPCGGLRDPVAFFLKSRRRRSAPRVAGPG